MSRITAFGTVSPIGTSDIGILCNVQSYACVFSSNSYYFLQSSASGTSRVDFTEAGDFLMVLLYLLLFVVSNPRGVAVEVCSDASSFSSSGFDCGL